MVRVTLPAERSKVKVKDAFFGNNSAAYGPIDFKGILQPKK